MEFKLDIPEKQFKAHLGIKENNRIIFSGAFGTGKTYFLEKFFIDNKSYEAIHLFPVNYSVASNEDIFELIKYDILFNLLEKDLDFEQTSISKGAFLPFFLKENSTEFIPFLLGIIPKVGGSLKETAEGLIKLNKKFEKDFKEANLSDKDQILSYLEGFTQKQGSTNEEDFITQLICELVDQLKEKGKEVVLIIDDLDRIDPEHIFRILNVLAAHVDVKKDSNQNKFDVNKIILVCDIENIRKIFANRYGANVDFSGYIDKFYSRSIFHYDLSGEIVKNINQVFHTASIIDGKGERSLAEDKKDISSILIKYILLSMLQYNLVPIRSLKRILDGNQPLEDRKFWKKGEHDSVSSGDIQIVKAIDFLIYLFQDYRVLLERSEYLIGKDLKNSLDLSKNFLISELLKGEIYKQYYSKISSHRTDSDKTHNLELGSQIFKYNISSRFDPQNLSDHYDLRIISVEQGENKDKPIDSLDFFEILTLLLKNQNFRQVLA